MENENSIMELTPENYVKIQNSVVENIANKSNKIIDCKKAIAAGEKTIREKEEEIRKLKFEIIDITNKCADINSMLLNCQRSIKIDTCFLSKLNTSMRRGRTTIVDVGKRLVKRKRK